MIFQEPKFNCVHQRRWNETMIYAIDPCLITFFGLDLCLHFATFIAPFCYCGSSAERDAVLLIFRFCSTWKKEASSTRKNFFNNFKEPSQVHRKSIVQSGERVKAETSDPDPQKRFRSSIVFARFRKAFYLLSCNHLSQLIVTWNSLPQFSAEHIEWIHLAIWKIGLGLKLNGLGSDGFQGKVCSCWLDKKAKRNVPWCNIKRALRVGIESSRRQDESIFIRRINHAHTRYRLAMKYGAVTRNDAPHCDAHHHHLEGRWRKDFQEKSDDKTKHVCERNRLKILPRHVAFGMRDHKETTLK